MRRLCILLVVCLWRVAAAATPADARITVFAIGDTGDCSLEGSRTVSAAMRGQPDWRQAWLIEAGDLAYPTATRARLEQCHEPYFGMFVHRLAVPGNHDSNDHGGRGFRSLFPAVPRAVKLPGPWRVWLLDSNLTGKAAARQLRWLEGQVASRGDACIIAVWHHPRWSSGWHGDDEAMASLWQPVAGVASIALNGHDHHYEAVPPLDATGQPSSGGTRSFIVGNGGATLYPAVSNHHNSKSVSGRWGFLRIDIDGRHYAWREISTGGETLDAGEGDCQLR